MPASATGAAALRFGITVGKRNARRSVDRSTIKRVLREAARQQRERLEQALGGRQLWVVLRLKAPLPAPSAGSKAVWRQAMRAEADALLAQLTRQLAATAGSW